MTLTSHRIIWTSADSQPRAGSIPLASVASDVQFKASNVISHREIRLHLRTDGQGRPLAGAQVLAGASLHFACLTCAS